MNCSLQAAVLQCPKEGKEGKEGRNISFVMMFMTDVSFFEPPKTHTIYFQNYETSSSPPPQFPSIVCRASQRRQFRTSLPSRVIGWVTSQGFFSWPIIFQAPQVCQIKADFPSTLIFVVGVWRTQQIFSDALRFPPLPFIPHRSFETLLRVNETKLFRPRGSGVHLRLCVSTGNSRVSHLKTTDGRICFSLYSIPAAEIIRVVGVAKHVA